MKNRSALFRLMLATVASAPLLFGQTVGADTGGKEQIAGSDQKLNYQGNGKHFEIAGNNDEITITGECADIQVLGHDNKITLEAVGSIQLVGQNNLVTYQRGLTGPKPSIQAMGENNKVVVAKE
jgi:hypothetical protein